MAIKTDNALAVALALKVTGMTQNKLARKLGVSPTQITKWKQGEYMSSTMEDKLKALAKIPDDLNPSVVAWAGSVEAAEKWNKLFAFSAKLASEGSESGYHTYPLEDEVKDLPGHLIWNTVHTFEEMGVQPPKKFPDDLNVAIKMIDTEDGDADEDAAWEAIETNPYLSLARRMYAALTGIWGFYTAYIQELTDDDGIRDKLGATAEDFEPCLMALAASKIKVDESFAPKIDEFRRTTLKEYKERCMEIKRAAIKAGFPLRAEIMNIVYEHHEALSAEAEAESFGFNDSALHPDIYMNELLTGMRTVHQILPVILKKLGIDKEEFTLDESDLYVCGGRQPSIDDDED